MRYPLVIVLFLLAAHPTTIVAQVNEARWQSINTKVSEVPLYAGNDPEELASYLIKAFPDRMEYIMAVYSWIGNNIAYDTDVPPRVMYSTKELPIDLIKSAIKTKEAICQGYSELFNFLCRKRGIESWVVTGYIRQAGKVADYSHAWIVLKIDSAWYMCEPTWSAGFVNGKTFDKKFSSEWFMITPDDFIKTHIPFDPMWQCLYHPVSHNNFYKNQFRENMNPGFFSFPDTIKTHVQADSLGQLLGIIRRVDKAGIINASTTQYREYLKGRLDIMKKNIEIARMNNMADLHNEAVTEYNKVVSYFNKYMKAKGSQFKNPVMTDLQIKRRITVMDSVLVIAETKIAGVSDIAPELKSQLASNKKLISEMRGFLIKEKSFANKYLATSPADRKKLFQQQ